MQEHGRNGADNCIWLALCLPEFQQSYEKRQQEALELFVRRQLPKP